MSRTEVLVVDSCLRGDDGGSPTAVVVTAGEEIGDVELARIPARTGTSHVAVICETGTGGRTIRFFTPDGELPGCGHGTVAALAVLALPDGGLPSRLRSAGRELAASARIAPGTGPDRVVETWFDQGPIQHRDATDDEQDTFLAALGLERNLLHPEDPVVVASPGRERLLIPVADRTVLAGIRPDHERLAQQSRRLGQLGCFVYVPPSPERPAAARMFAPAIGVPEDVANANSSGCLAARLLLLGRDPNLTVDQGDALGRPSTVHATARRSEAGVVTRVGGRVRVRS
jgi:trans-2,3-dihydro-3-hydroxyanthranilate isomerase